jgi:hypothetical protein
MESKINKIIDIVHQLREDGMGAGAVSGAPTNNASSGNIAGLPPDQPPVDLRKGRRRNWNPFFKNLAKMQRRKPPQ